jgi:hypothetical protein
MKSNTSAAGGADNETREGPARKVRIPDTLCERGAIALAKRLESYWHERGFAAARFWAEPINERFRKVGSYDIYRVACNLVNALPPRYREG